VVQTGLSMFNVKYNNDYIVTNDESLHGHYVQMREESESGIRK